VSPIDERLQATAAEPPTDARWTAHAVAIRVDGERRVLRLVRFPRGWLASTDTVDGPTLGHDASPYLAARRALDPLGVGLVTAMAAVAGLDRSIRRGSAR